MKRSTLILSTFLLAAALPALVIAQSNEKAVPATSVTGTWQCMSHGGQNGDTPFTLTLQQDGETVTGSVSSPLGDADLSSASFKDGTLRIEIDTENQPYILSATLANGELKGQWSHGQEQGPWEGKKAAAASKSQSETQ